MRESFLLLRFDHLSRAAAHGIYQHSHLGQEYDYCSIRLQRVDNKHIIPHTRQVSLPPLPAHDEVIFKLTWLVIRDRAGE